MARCGSSSRPLHHGRQRRQDRIDIAAGAQPEDCAAVIEQIELDIAATAHKLFLALGFCPWFCKILPHEIGIDIKKCETDVLGEGKSSVPIALKIIVKDTADAAHLAAVFQVEILIAPL